MIIIRLNFVLKLYRGSATMQREKERKKKYDGMSFKFNQLIAGITLIGFILHFASIPLFALWIEAKYNQQRWQKKAYYFYFRILFFRCCYSLSVCILAFYVYYTGVCDFDSDVMFLLRAIYEFTYFSYRFCYILNVDDFIFFFESAATIKQ